MGDESKVYTLKPGKHAICNCGKTNNAPYCDGGHAGSGKGPAMREVKSEEQERIKSCR